MERNLSSFQTRSDELTTKNSVIVVFNPLWINCYGTAGGYFSFFGLMFLQRISWDISFAGMRLSEIPLWLILKCSLSDVVWKNK
jgi:hypothetical protein